MWEVLLADISRLLIRGQCWSCWVKLVVWNKEAVLLGRQPQAKVWLNFRVWLCIDLCCQLL